MHPSLLPVITQRIFCVCGETWFYHTQRSVPLGRPLQAGGTNRGLSGLAAALSRRWWGWSDILLSCQTSVKFLNETFVSSVRIHAAGGTCKEARGGGHHPVHAGKALQEESEPREPVFSGTGDQLVQWVEHNTSLFLWQLPHLHDTLGKKAANYCISLTKTGLWKCM